MLFFRRGGDDDSLRPAAKAARMKVLGGTVPTDNFDRGYGPKLVNLDFSSILQLQRGRFGRVGPGINVTKGGQ